MYTLAFVCIYRQSVSVYYLMIKVILDRNVKFAYLIVPTGVVC